MFHSSPASPKDPAFQEYYKYTVKYSFKISYKYYHTSIVYRLIQYQNYG